MQRQNVEIVFNCTNVRLEDKTRTIQQAVLSKLRKKQYFSQVLSNVKNRGIKIFVELPYTANSFMNANREIHQVMEVKAVIPGSF